MLVRVLILVTVLQLVSGLEKAELVKDLAVIDNRTYYFSEFVANTLDGAVLCADVNMTMLSLETVEEHTAVANFLQNLNNNITYWTSGVHVIGDWLWSGSGTMFSSAMWDVGEPDETDITRQTCVLLQHPSGKLNDYDCYFTFYIACEQRDCS
ncbi:hypothetical protein B566_EDAN007780 [Ephemera danica]|nr:hypothetical protein B566_EDAN007780 [Ephemera danica]